MGRRQISLVTWNVRGTLQSMTSECRGKLAQFFRSFDIVAITHTGVVNTVRGYPLISRDLVCKGIVNRAHLGQAGGVACYVRKWLSPYVTSVMERREQGVMWVKIAKEAGLEKDLYMAIVYLPCESSSFYRLAFPHREFLDDLEVDILRFSSLGSILLAGDFNSRTGSLARLACEAGDRHGQSASSTNSSVFTARMGRSSEDTIVNEWGKELLRLCDRHGLYIANGVPALRSSGEHTFQSTATVAGRALPQSVIDYFIMSTEVASSRWESGKGELKVIPISACPRTHRDGAFDHKPVNLVLPLTNEPQRRIRAEHTVTKLLWRDELREPYVDHLRS